MEYRVEEQERQHQRPAPATTVPAAAATARRAPAATGPGALLALQRLAGNRAAAGLLAPTPVQRLKVDGWAPEISGPTDVRTGEGPQPTSDDVVLKQGEGGAEAATSPSAIHRLAFGYVKQAGKDHGKLEEDSRFVAADHDVVSEIVGQWRQLDEKVKAGQLGAEDRTKTVTAQQKLMQSIHEPDPVTALDRSTQRNDDATRANQAAVRERAMVEHYYDLVQAKRNELKGAKLDARIRERSGGVGGLDGDQRAQGTAEMRGWTQQAKLSADVVAVKKMGVRSQRKELIDADRLPGTMRALAGKIVGGVAGAVVNIGTLGMVTLGSATDDRGYLKGRLLPGNTAAAPQKGFPFKPSFLFNTREVMARYDSERKLRKGTSPWDRISGVLLLLNEMVLQPIVNIASAAGTWLTVLGLILTAALGAATMGAGTPLGGAMAAAGLGIAAVALAAGLVKLAVNGFRATAGSVAALWNDDAKTQNQLNARAGDAGLDTLASAGQAAALGAGVAMLGTGGGAINGIQGVGASAVKGVITGGKVATTVGTGAVARGLAGSKSATIENYRRGEVTAPEGSATASYNRSAGNRFDLAGPGDDRRIGGGAQVPEWLERESAKENAGRDAARESRTAVARGEAQWVSSRAGELKKRVQSVLAPLIRLAGWFAKGLRAAKSSMVGGARAAGAWIKRNAVAAGRAIRSGAAAAGRGVLAGARAAGSGLRSAGTAVGGAVAGGASWLGRKLGGLFGRSPKVAPTDDVTPEPDIQQAPQAEPEAPSIEEHAAEESESEEGGGDKVEGEDEGREHTEGMKGFLATAIEVVGSIPDEMQTVTQK